MSEAQEVKFQINFSASFQSSSNRIQRSQNGDFQQVFNQQRDQANTTTQESRRDSRPEVELDRQVNDRSRADESQRGRDSNVSASDRDRSSEAPGLVRILTVALINPIPDPMINVVTRRLSPGIEPPIAIPMINPIPRMS